MTEQISRNVHLLGLHTKKLAVLSDIHWDNPKCDRKKLKSHLDYCKENQIPVFINGDFFCMMQGKYDPRRSKKDILPEHNKVNYIDAVIEDAVSWFSPYAEILSVIGYGNHETSIVKNLETDPLQRFVDLLNFTCKSKVFTGGYGGWLIARIPTRENQDIYKSHRTLSKNIKYFHGSGGGGIVTKGAINLTRALETYEGMDAFLLGHIHENSCRDDFRDSLEWNSGKKIHELKQKQIHHCITGTYKEEYGDGAFGWHVERGAPIKATGGRILNFNVTRIQSKDKGESYEVIIDSTKFPI